MGAAAIADSNRGLVRHSRSTPNLLTQAPNQ